MLKNVEVLTAGEEGGASGSCQKNVPSIMRADCDGDGKFESTFAIITTYSCEGDGSGPCKSGTVSTTYDCEGYVVIPISLWIWIVSYAFGLCLF